MSVIADLLDRLDLPAAIQQAAPPRGEFFPSRLEAEAALAAGASYSEWIEAQMQLPYGQETPEIVWVPRADLGYRPVPYLGFQQRVLLGALTNLLAQEIVDELEWIELRSLTDPEDGSRRSFERLPIDAGSSFIVMADVASYYEYVDHGRLGQDIVELTSDVDLAEAITELLAALIGRDFGIPQGPRPSDVLADVYLAAVDRRLARAGAESWRYNDDFLIGAKDEQQARLWLRDLEEALRQRGLVLNHQKNRVASLGIYVGWVDLLAEKLAVSAIENVDTSFYSFDPDVFAELEIDEVDLGVVESLFLRSLEGDEPDPYRVNSRILQQTLPILAKEGSQVPLEYLDELVEDWGAHSRHFSLYLRELLETDVESEMISAVGASLNKKREIAPWVKGWLLDPLARCDHQLNRRGLGAKIKDWFLSDREPWFVRGRCALVLAQRGFITDQKTFDRIFSHAPAATRADLVAAVRLAEPSWGQKWLRSLDPNDPLLIEIAKWSPEDWSSVL
jgi:Reverse transcriptase (RNA-dependent DNA polymerase)